MADRSRSERETRYGGTLPNGAKIKEEPEDMDVDSEDNSIPTFGPAALGLHRVGTILPPKPAPIEPLQKLNARGMPARIRKKNRLFFDDDIVNSPPPRSSPKKYMRTPGKTPNKTPLSAKKQKSPSKVMRMSRVEDKMLNDKDDQSGTPDRKSGQNIGMRLRNLLKLPKAHKWVCFEYFYSNIDKTLFDGENDFMICLKESFPQLKDLELTCRTQWTKIRRMMGKPRRCSQAFFSEERKELERKRQKIRCIQQRKSADVSYKDLPNEIPMQLVVGTKVTARLRKPQDGLFTGSIDAVDVSNNTYRITFERVGLGTHSVPDFEVLSNDSPETFYLSSITKFRPRQVQQDFINLYAGKSLLPDTPHKSFSDPLIGSSGTFPEIENTGVYPVRLLVLIVRITKVLNAKKTRIKRLREFNSEAEKRKSFGEKMPDDFERKYAATVIELEKMNMDLQDYINEVQSYCHEIAPGPSFRAMLAPSHLREKCREDAVELVDKHNVGTVRNDKILELVTDLTALMFQVKSLSDSDKNAYELKVLQGTMEQIKMKLQPSHQQLFQNCIEIHMQRIQMGLGQMALNTYMTAAT